MHINATVYRTRLNPLAGRVQALVAVSRTRDLWHGPPYVGRGSCVVRRKSVPAVDLEPVRCSG